MRVRAGALLAFTLSLLYVLAPGASSAAAAPTDKFIFNGEITGKAMPDGILELVNLAVNEETGYIVGYDQHWGGITQVDPATEEAVPFGATGSPVIKLGLYLGGANVDIAIDNSGTASQGNIYLSVKGTGVWAFDASGEPLTPNQPLISYSEPPLGVWTCTIAVGADAKIWLNEAFSFPGFYAFNPDGTSTGVVYTPSGDAGSGCRSAFDSEGYFYVADETGDVIKHDKVGAELATLGPVNDGSPGIVDFATDPASEKVFIDRGDTIKAFAAGQPPEPKPAVETLEGLGSRGIALDSTGEYLFTPEGFRISIFHRQSPGTPEQIGGTRISEVRSRSAKFIGRFRANGAPTEYHWEVGTDTNYGTNFPATDVKVPYGNFTTTVNDFDEDLQAGTTYHVRLALTNEKGTVYGPDATFTTYPTPPGGVDDCANALERKQTQARTLPDCRAYELVSAFDTAGYDVESSLVAGQDPFHGYPDASDPTRVLYGTHAGAVPGPWNPTNRGPDPYVATRDEGARKWTTEYVGLPADLNPASGPFSSVLGEANPTLDTFGFAGTGLCEPCFTSGLETGLPLRREDGTLLQGMEGPDDESVPANAKPEGKVDKLLSADGDHLIFASRYSFVDGAHDDDGNLTVYERDLTSAVPDTKVVSTGIDGQPLSGTISERDISADGSRVLIAQGIGTDAAGNEYVHPYLHLAGSATSVDLAPATSAGSLLAGMTPDGSTVFLATADKLLSADTDSSADIYRVAVDAAGTAFWELVSDLNSSACNPVSNSAGPHWNAVGPAADCGAVAIAGGGGLARDDGTFYFLSPEQLDGSAGTLNQANLYRSAIGGGPEFVVTLEPGNPLVLDAVQDSGTRDTGDFETTPDGLFAIFRSALPLTGINSFGKLAAFRFKAPVGSDPAQIGCASCDPTGAGEDQLAADASFAAEGLSLSDDGRVFYNTLAPLVLNDTNQREDVYEWSGGAPLLISDGIGAFSSKLLTTSHDGVDAYFFTHAKLSPQGQEGTMTRIYDARELGGFLVLPPLKACAASDECHGPGTVPPATPDIRTAAAGAAQNVPRQVKCKKGFVKKKGKCVKKQGKKGKKNKRGRKHG
jgi:hypothetical protein